MAYRLPQPLAVVPTSGGIFVTEASDQLICRPQHGGSAGWPRAIEAGEGVRFEAARRIPAVDYSFGGVIYVSDAGTELHVLND